jgi:cytochrome d ubiquinol oxidase subunit I
VQHRDGTDGFVAVLAGSPPVGRSQPFTVYGLLWTSDSLAPRRSTCSGGFACGVFIVVHFFVWRAGTFYLLVAMNQTADPHLGLNEGPIRLQELRPSCKPDPPNPSTRIE